jgi:Zn-dependent protease
MSPAEAIQCECGAQLAPGLLNCPVCTRLVHAAKLKDIANRAGAAEREGRVRESLSAWREALPLLPPDSRQYAATHAKIVALSGQVDAAHQTGGTPWWKRGSTLSGMAIIAAILSKGKFLLLGFSKMGTLLSFVAGLSVYWALFGWQFALCFLLSIYVHEMGHVAALHRFGIPATAPTFIPGFGAYVRLKQHPATAKEDARVGLAGPEWGLAAALFAFALYAFTGYQLWAAVARAGAWINLFNLIPVWQLDGARGLRTLDRNQTWMLAFLSAGMWLWVQDGMLLILTALMVYRAFTTRNQPDEPDWNGFIRFAGLITVLSILCLIPIPKFPR